MFVIFGFSLNSFIKFNYIAQILVCQPKHGNKGAGKTI